MLSSLSGCEALQPASPAIHGEFADPCALMASRDCLRNLMRSLSHEIYDQKLNALEVEDERRRQAIQLADRIKRVSRSVRELADNNSLELDDEDKAAFTMLVARLSKQGEEIRSSALDYRIRAMNVQLDRVAGTCNECHLLFKEY